MGKRGPKSADELAIKPQVTSVARPNACYSLPDEAAEVWRATVEALPANWIGPEAHPLLAAYSRTTIALRRLGQLIHQEESCGGEGLDFDLHGKLLRSHAQQAQTLKTLATALRLSPQTRFRAEKAAVTRDGHAAGPKPWEA